MVGIGNNAGLPDGAPTMPTRATFSRSAGALLLLLVITVTTTPSVSASASPQRHAATKAEPAPELAARKALGYPRQPILKVFGNNPLDSSIERGATPYAQIAPRLTGLMAKSDLVSVEVIGSSVKSRDLYLVTVTAPETPEQTAQQTAWRELINHDPAAAAADPELQAGYKVPIWFNSNIHGDEWEGTDASLDYIYDLITAPEDQTAALMAGTRLYFTVSANPDGRVLGERANVQGLDLNRDFVTYQSPEARAIRDVVDDIQPVFFSDIHGYRGVLQIEPCGPPHGENYDYDLFLPHNYAAALRIEADVTAAHVPGNTYKDANGKTTKTPTNKLVIPYRDIPAGWDDWPPVFTVQYLAYFGAITQTLELPLSTDDDPVVNKANFAVDVAVAQTAIDSTVDYVTENRDALLDNQIEIFRRGAAGEPLVALPVPADPATVPGPDQWAPLWGPEDQFTTTFPRVYVIPVGAGQRSRGDAANLVNALIADHVQVRQATGSFILAGTDYPAGSYLVDMHQPMRGLANTLLAVGSDISDRTDQMYDIAAWSLGSLWGASVIPVGSTGDELEVEAPTVTAATLTDQMPPAGSYLSFPVTGERDVQAVNRLLYAGVPVAYRTNGSVVVAPNRTASVAAAAAAFGVDVGAVPAAVLQETGLRYLKPLRIGYVGGPDDLLSLKEMGFANPTLISPEILTAGKVKLTDVDVLWIAGQLIFGPSQSAGAAQLTAYVKAGKGLVGAGLAAKTVAADRGLVSASIRSGNIYANGIVTVKSSTGSILAPAGAADPPMGTAYVNAPICFYSLTGTTVALQTYGPVNPLKAGHWRSTNASDGPTQAANKASVIFGSSVQTGAKAVIFGTDPLFRTHPKGMFTDVARALFEVGPQGIPVPGP
ncbi:peptidase M14 [Nakamurella silvestris]|nr:peptidase M14 [Nakamurella silvestris]